MVERNNGYMRNNDYEEYNESYSQPQPETPNQNTNNDEFQRPSSSDEANFHLQHRFKDKKPVNKYLHIVGQIFKWGFASGVLLVFIGIGLFAYYASKAPSISQSQLQNAGSSTLYTNDGKLLFSLGDDKRTYIKSKDIPQQLKDALISIEDRRFYQEKYGVDPIRTAGALVNNLRGGNMAGGSSLTQQLVKLSVFSTNEKDRTFKRKIQEAWLSVKISQQYSREQILEFYVNKVYMNYNQYGLQTASEFYYGKSLQDLDLAQTALMAGMPNAPTIYNPYIYPKFAKQRRDLVLKAMLSNDKINQQQYEQATKESITKGLKTKHPTNSKQRRIDDPYIKEVISEVKADGFDPYRDNLKITINIDQKVQNKLYELANDGEVPFPDDKMQIASTVVDPSNGHIIAILGGRKLPNVQLGYDRAVQTVRSTGSSIKPVLDYAPAIEYKNWSTAQVLQDTPYTYKGTNVQLYDWDDRYQGAMTMRYALEQSRNVPAVRTLEEIGLGRGAKFAKKMGINVDPKQGLSVAIGANASTVQMAGAFGAFATEGIYHKPRFVHKVEAPDGLTRNYDDSGTRVMKDSTAYMITDMLKGVITQGNGKYAKISDVYQAGKTGTVKYSDQELASYPSYRNTPKDSWFVGYTKQYSIGVWTGYDKIREGTIDKIGERSAQLFYKEMMSYLMENKTSSDWTKPDDVIAQKVKIGRAITTELYVKGHAPSFDNIDTDKVKKSKTKDKDSDDKDNNDQDKKDDNNNNNNSQSDSSTQDNDDNSSQNQNVVVNNDSDSGNSNNSNNSDNSDNSNSDNSNNSDSGTTTDGNVTYDYDTSN